MAIATARLFMKEHTSAQWATSPYVGIPGEMMFDSTVEQMKIGNGVSLFPALPWQGDQAFSSMQDLTLLFNNSLI